MNALRSASCALLILAGATTALAARDSADVVCDDRFNLIVDEQYYSGVLLGEEDVHVTTFVATWWPGYPVVTVGFATGWYQMSDGTVIGIRCSSMRPN
jgi:hypothetical protein